MVVLGRRVLYAAGVGSSPFVADETTGDIDHTGMVMMLDHRGYIRWRLDGGWGRVRELLAAMPSGNGA